MQQAGSPVSVMLLAHDEVLPSNADGIVLGEVTAKPLTLDDWFKYQNGEPLFVEIRGRVDVGSNTSKPGAPPVGTWVCRSLQIDPAIKNESICLVDGGWLPLIYCLAGTNIFVDKNVVAEIKARFDGGTIKPGVAAEKDFLDLLVQQPCSSSLNPLPYGLEGNIQGLPDVDLVHEQLRIALADLAGAIPDVKVWPKSYDRAQTQATLDSYRPYFSEDMEFLQKVGPSLMATTGRSKRRAAWQMLIQAARETGISPQHMSVVMALSALTASQNFNPAKKVLKPAIVYGAEQAYNATWDVFLLFLLRQFQLHSPVHRSALLTRDKNLAMLWMGMKIQKVSTDLGGGFQAVFDERLLKCDAEEVAYLQTLLGSNKIHLEHPLS